MELLVVISVISILAGMLLPALDSALASAHLRRCSNNIKQLGLAHVLYSDDNRGRVATPYTVDGKLWHNRINPYADNMWKGSWGLQRPKGIWQCDSNLATGATKYIFHGSAYLINERFGTKTVARVKKPSSIALHASAGWDVNWLGSRATYVTHVAIKGSNLNGDVAMGFWHCDSQRGTAVFLDMHVTTPDPMEAILPTYKLNPTDWAGIFYPPGAF